MKMNSQTVSHTEKEEIRQLCLSAGADLAGMASVGRFTEAPTGFHPTDILSQARTVIVLAGRFAQEAVSAQPPGYTAMRNESVRQMNEIATTVAKSLKKRGYKAKVVHPIRCGKHNDRTCGPLSLKHAAQLAGLGHIGRNHLLTHETFGNMLWFSAVVTDLELPPDPLSDQDFCKQCNLCVGHCPSGALNEEIFNQKACRKHAFTTKDSKLEIRCWKCRTICPHGIR